MFTLFKSRWPVPEYDKNDEPHFLFIITPPYSGSTALTQLLNSSHRTMILESHGEGQWLIPDLCRSDRWEKSKYVDYTSVKAVWLHTYQKVRLLTKNVDVVIEKSPPNMMRLEQLTELFRSYSLLANNRNPYASSASMLYRKYKAEKLSDQRRIKILEEQAVQWLERSKQIYSLMQKLEMPLLTYEQFCENPESLLPLLKLPEGVTDSINFNASVKVKDYAVQKISNQNARQIALLKNSEIEAMSRVLENQQNLLKVFDYRLL